MRTAFDGRRFNLMTLLNRISEAHHCDIVVYHAPRRERNRNRYQEMPMSWTIDPPMRIPAAPTPTVGFRLPAEAPERAVQRAAQQLRDEQVLAVMTAFAVPRAMLEPPRPVEPRKSDQSAKDRFELIELD